MSITLAELITDIRNRADMENSEFVSDAELTRLINKSIAELHDLLIQAYEGDYYVEEVEFTTSGQAESYPISTVVPAGNFYKLRGLDAKLNGTDWRTIRPFNFNERNKNKYGGDFLGITNVRYRLLGSNIRFTPIPDDNMDMKLWYIPTAQVLVNNTDSYDDFNGYSEYVIVDVAIKILNKEESDVSVLMSEKKDLKRRLEEAANNRDAGAGDTVSDVYDENSNYYEGYIR